MSKIPGILYIFDKDVRCVKYYRFNIEMQSISPKVVL